MPDDEVIYMSWQEEAFAGIRGRLEAGNTRLRAALEQIAAYGCDSDWGLVGRQTCTQRKSADPCPSRIAAAALEEK